MLPFYLRLLLFRILFLINLLYQKNILKRFCFSDFPHLSHLSIFLKSMSLDKFRNNKIARPSETYSRNPIINNLIRNKLETEIAGVKDTVANIIKREQSSSNLLKSKTKSLKRLQKSYTITPKKINQSLQYDPVQRIQNYVQQFIVNRQLQSFLIPRQQLQEIHDAREQSGGLNVKFSKSDEIRFESNQNLRNLVEKVKGKTRNQLGNEIWIPDKPQVQHMIEDRLQMINESNTSIIGERNSQKIGEEIKKFKSGLIPSSTLQTSKTQANLNSIRPPLTSYSSVKKQPLKTQFPTDYNTNKYHKDDYKSVDKWFQDSLVHLADLVAKQSQMNSSINQYTLNYQLDLIYGLYLSAWKQLIRLTYIQSYEKGLLFEKLLYSMLRLLDKIIQQQHITARDYQNSREKEVRDIREMLEQRCDRLNEKYEQNNQIIDDLKRKNHRLSVSYIAFEKVNKQLMDETQKLYKGKKKSEEQLNSINRAYVKALEKLSDKGLIEVQIEEPQDKPKKRLKKGQPPPSSYKTYYMLGNDNKPITLGRFKYFGSSMGQYAMNEEITVEGSQEMFQYNKKIIQLENQINRFWSKKQDDLQLRGTINSSLLNIKIQDASTGTTQVEPINFGCQFPDTGQNIIEKLLLQQKNSLQKQFDEQREQLKAHLAQTEALLKKWISNNETNAQKIKVLQQNTNTLNDTLKKQKQTNNEIQKEITDITKNNHKLQQQLQELTKNKLFLENQIQILKQRCHEAQQETEKAMKLMNKEKDNNNYLVRNSLKAQEQMEKSKVRLENLVLKVKAVAPYLQKFMGEIDRAAKESSEQLEGLLNMELMGQISAKIEEHLSDYVEKDSGLFSMTKI